MNGQILHRKWTLESLQVEEKKFYKLFHEWKFIQINNSFKLCIGDQSRFYIFAFQKECWTQSVTVKGEGKFLLIRIYIKKQNFSGLSGFNKCTSKKKIEEW